MTQPMKEAIEKALRDIDRWHYDKDGSFLVTPEMTLTTLAQSIRDETIEECNKDEAILRQLLWVRHGCSLDVLYGDDGEMQCGRCMIDFKRMSAEQIQQRWEDLGTKLLRKHFEKTDAATLRSQKGKI